MPGVNKVWGRSGYPKHIYFIFDQIWKHSKYREPLYLLFFLAEADGGGINGDFL